MGNATLEIACIGYSNTVVRCDTGFSIETFLRKTNVTFVTTF